MERKANNGGGQSLLVQKLQLNAGAAFPVPTGESIHFMHGGGDYGPEVIRAEVHPLGGRGSVGQAVGNVCPDDRIEAGTEQRPDLFKESERNCAKSEEHIFMISSSEGGSGSSSSSRGLHVGESIFSDQKPSLSSISKDSGGSVGGLPKIPLLTKFNCTYKRSNPVGTAKRVLTLVKDANRSGTPELPVITTKERCLAEARYNERPNNNGSCLDARKRKAESEPSVSHFHGEISRADAKLMEGRCMLSPGSSVISNDFKGRKNIEFGKDLVDSRWDSNDKENINPVKDHRRCTGKGREFSNQVIAGDKNQSKAPEKLRNARKLPNTGRVTSQTSFSLLKQLTEGKMPKALMQVAAPLEDPNADEKADKDRYVPTARISSVTHATSIKDPASFLNPPAMAERHCEGILPASCADLEIELREASPYLVGETLVTPEMECLASSSNAQVRSADAKRISSVPINSLNQQEGCSGVSLPSALFGPHGIAESHVQGIEHGKFSLSSSCPTLPATSTLPSIASSSINSQSQHFMRDDIPTLRKPSPCSGDDLIDSMTPGATCVAEVSESKVMPTSVRDLTSSLSSLSIADSLCQEDLHASYVNQKTGSTGADSHPVGKTHCSSEMDIKPCSSSNQLGSVPDEARTVISLSGPIADLNQKQGCSIVSMQSSSFAPLANAGRHVQEIEHGKSSLSSAYSVSHVSSIPSFITPCSITLRTASAPLASSFSDGHHFMEDNIQALKKPTLCSADEILKASHGSHVGGAPSKASLPTTSGLERAPQVELPMSGGEQPIDGSRQGSQVDKPKPEGEVPKSAVFSQVNDISEKKGFIGGEAVVQQKKRWENEHYIWVNGKRYQKLGKIGSGGSSEVYKVIASDCTIYALKRIKLKGRDYSSACGFHQEINYLEKLRGKSSIIQLIDYEVTDKSLFNGELRSSHTIRDDVFIYMVLEYGEIDLAHMLADKWKERSRGNKPLDENWLRLYWHQILEAVNTIHEERIVHSDLKPANFLLVKGVLKLIDFGIAKAIQNDTTNIVRESQVGTLNYMSPEAFMMNEKDEHGQVVKCGRSSDIWSLGCILYQMVYGSTPFSNITNLWAKVKEITNRNHKIKFPPLSNPFLLDIMKKCLAWNRDERLRIPQLLEHPFLRPHAALIFNPHNKQHIMDALLHIQQEYQFHPDIQILTQQLMEKLRSLEAPTNVLASE